MKATSTRVWDPLLRTLHWVLVLGVTAAWFTTIAWSGWHEPAGWTAAACVALRVAWGFVGPRHARFGSFLRGPRETIAYARLFMAGRAPRHLGHNPLGAWMSVALLACVALLALTGWLYTTDRFWGEVWLDVSHQALAWTLLVLVGMHVAGVLFTGLRHGESLVLAMLNGRKRRCEPGDID